MTIWDRSAAYYRDDLALYQVQRFTDTTALTPTSIASFPTVGQIVARAISSA